MTDPVRNPQPPPPPAQPEGDPVQTTNRINIPDRVTWQWRIRPHQEEFSLACDHPGHAASIANSLATETLIWLLDVRNVHRDGSTGAWQAAAHLDSRSNHAVPTPAGCRKRAQIKVIE